MNSSLHEIQSDLQRLASQQNQVQSAQMQSFSTLQNNFVNSRGGGMGQWGAPASHSLVYNSPGGGGTGWHSLVNQSPPPPQPQPFNHHNFVNQQQQVGFQLYSV